MIHPYRKESDNLLEILRAYKIPTITMAVGLIVAVIGFQMALQYDIRQSHQSFQELSDQLYRSMDTEMRRHERLVGSISQVLGQIKSLDEQDFSNISEAFRGTSHYVSFHLYKYNAGDGLIKIEKDSVSAEGGSITEFLINRPSQDQIDTINDLDEIRSAVEKSRILNKTYLSSPYHRSQSGTSDFFIVASTPVPERHRAGLYLVGILDLNKFFSNTMVSESESLNVRIYDLFALEKNLIYEKIDPHSQEFLETASQEIHDTLSFKRTRFFDDHNWEIVIFSSLYQMINYIGLFPWITFLSILCVTGLISYIIFRITTENLKAAVLVERQTRSLREYAEKLEITNRDLDDFAHIASHDLKEPLRGIYNFSEFLSEDYRDKLDEDGRYKLETLKTLSRRMESLIESLLEYSRLSRIDLAFKKTDLKGIIEGVLESLSVYLDENNARVEIKEPIPEVRCDPVRVAEIFRNLLTNAVKYNVNQEKLIEIGCLEDTEKWKDTPVFYVKDNGIGIADEHKRHIFKIFKRLHGRNEYGGGTGAGLTIVSKIVERHNGKIWLESEPDKGTTFFFTLKRKKNDAKQAA